GYPDFQILVSTFVISPLPALQWFLRHSHYPRYRFLLSLKQTDQLPPCCRFYWKNGILSLSCGPLSLSWIKIPGLPASGTGFGFPPKAERKAPLNWRLMGEEICS